MQALRRLDEKRVAIASIEVGQPSLDDVFLTLTGRPADPEADERTAREAA